MTLRPAKSEDAELIYQIKYEAYARYAIESRGFWDETFQRGYTSKNLEDTQMILVGEQPAGWIAVRAEGEALEILDIHIRPAHQRKGLGSAAITSVLSTARSRGKRVNLSVLKNNPSRSLYERLGFGTTGQTESHWLMEHP